MRANIYLLNLRRRTRARASKSPGKEKTCEFAFISTRTIMARAFSSSSPKTGKSRARGRWHRSLYCAKLVTLQDLCERAKMGVKLLILIAHCSLVITQNFIKVFERITALLYTKNIILFFYKTFFRWKCTLFYNYAHTRM